MDVQSVPLSLVQVATTLYVRCDVCEVRVPFVVYLHHEAEMHYDQPNGVSAGSVLDWVGAQAQESPQARLLLTMLQSTYEAWKAEQG